MTKAIVLALVLAVAPGCTLVFGAAGGGIAAHQSHQEELVRARRNEPAGSSSVMPAVLAGAGVGMIVDALVIGFVLSEMRDGIRGADPLFPPTPGAEN